MSRAATGVAASAEWQALVAAADPATKPLLAEAVPTFANGTLTLGYAASKRFLRDRAEARRDKLLGIWAAGKLGISGAAADAYAKEVVAADFDEPGDADVFRKLRKDFDAKNIAVTDAEIRRTMDELLAQAVAEVKAGK